MDVSIVLAYVVTALLVSVVPGPDMLFIVANEVVGGRRAGVIAAAGMSTGLAVHTTAAALGLGAVIQAAPDVLNCVRIAGAAFLLYLAFLSQFLSVGMGSWPVTVQLLVLGGLFISVGFPVVASIALRRDLRRPRRSPCRGQPLNQRIHEGRQLRQCEAIATSRITSMWSAISSAA
jgi:threonine/homoserine/homoserine lactone efflux protein